MQGNDRVSTTISMCDISAAALSTNFLLIYSIRLDLKLVDVDNKLLFTAWHCVVVRYVWVWTWTQASF